MSNDYSKEDFIYAVSSFYRLIGKNIEYLKNGKSIDLIDFASLSKQSIVIDLSNLNQIRLFHLRGNDNPLSKYHVLFTTAFKSTIQNQLEEMSIDQCSGLYGLKDYKTAYEIIIKLKY